MPNPRVVVDPCTELRSKTTQLLFVCVFCTPVTVLYCTVCVVCSGLSDPSTHVRECCGQVLVPL
jgi:hypothetical protein